MFEFLANISANTSAFSKASAATVPSSLDNGGNECVEKLELIDYTKDQKDLPPLGQGNSLFLMETKFSFIYCGPSAKTRVYVTCYACNAVTSMKETCSLGI